jgi:predicted metalloprotease with PDZ domain
MKVLSRSPIFRLLSLLILLMPTSTFAQDIEYLVSLPAPQTQTLSISYTVRGVTDSSLEVSMPVWRPGRYQVLDPAGSIRSISAKAGNGKPLAIVKVEKSTWIVKTNVPEDNSVTVTYELYANSLADRTRHVDDTHAFLSPASIFLFSHAYRDRPLRVKIDGPKDWAVACGLEPAPGGDPNILQAATYDILADSPIEVGIHEKIAFDVDGTPHEIAIWTGRAPSPHALERDKLTKDIASVIRHQRDIFVGPQGPFPYSRYIFLVHCFPGGRGGTEHLNSTVLQISPNRFTTPEGTRSFYGLVSHEYFHTYNVKQLRPAGLKPYNYLHENYTELLWVAEGTTSYYDDLTLARVGLSKPDDYLKSLAEGIDAYRRRPGANVQSLEDSSFDAWIKFNKPDADAVNSTVSFYDKGAHASLLIDFELRRLSGGKVSLDHVMADLYRNFPLSGPGFTTEDFIATCERLSAAGDIRAFIIEAVRSTKPLDFDAAFSLAGLEIVNDAKKEDGSDVLKQKAYIGLNVEAKEGIASVTSVLSDGPAYAAGIIAGDSLVALNGSRLRTPAELDSTLKTLKPGSQVKLSLFRHDTLREIDFKADGRPDGKWIIRRIKEPTAEQKAVYESWLHQKWPEGSDDKKPDKIEDQPRPAGPTGKEGE